MKGERHWTAGSLDDFQYSVASDLVHQIDQRLDRLMLSRADFAELIGKTEGRVSQIFNNPGNLTLRSMIGYARAVGMKSAVMAYDDGDAENLKGPIHPDVFVTCWERMGKPIDMWAFEKKQMDLGAGSLAFAEAFFQAVTGSIGKIETTIGTRFPSHQELAPESAELASCVSEDAAPSPDGNPPSNDPTSGLRGLAA